MNHDGIPDIAIMAAGKSPDGNCLRGGRTFVLYGGSANLAALDAADGASDGRIGLSTFDAPAADGTHGFVINGYEIPALGREASLVSAAGDVNGDRVDDLLMSSYPAVIGQEVYVVFGRDSTAGNTFPAAFELSSLLAANGGDGSDGFVIRPLPRLPYVRLERRRRRRHQPRWHRGHRHLGFVGEPSSGRSSAGQVYVIFGQTSFAATFDLAALNGNNGFTVNGEAADDMLGIYSAGPAGDVNGDGVDDLLMSATFIYAPDGAAAGGAYVLFGKNGRHSRPSSRYPPSTVPTASSCTGSRRATSPATPAQPVTSTATATTT